MKHPPAPCHTFGSPGFCRQTQLHSPCWRRREVTTLCSPRGHITSPQMKVWRLRVEARWGSRHKGEKGRMKLSEMPEGSSEESSGSTRISCGKSQPQSERALHSPRAAHTAAMCISIRRLCGFDIFLLNSPDHWWIIYYFPRKMSPKLFLLHKGADQFSSLHWKSNSPLKAVSTKNHTGKHRGLLWPAMRSCALSPATVHAFLLCHTWSHLP